MMQLEQVRPPNRRLILTGVAFVVGVAVLLTLVQCSTVPTGYRGVRLSFQRPTGEVVNEGLYFYSPIIGQSIVEVNAQTQALNVDSSAATKDLQPVNAKETVNFHLDPAPASLVHVYDTLRNDYEARIVLPTVQEAVKAATAQHNAPDLLANRPVVRNAIETTLAQRLKPFGIIVDQVLLVDLQFSPEYQKAVEEKVAAQQQAQTAQINAQRDYQVAQLNAQAAIAKARGEAEAQRLQRQTLSQPLLTLKLIEKWDGHYPQYMLGGSPATLLQIPSPEAK